MFRRISRNNAVSPVIATVLLVAMTVAIGAVIYMWVADYGTSKSAPRVHGTLSSTDPNTYRIDLTTQDKGCLDDLMYLLQRNGTTFEEGKLSDVYNLNISIWGNVSFVDVDKVDSDGYGYLSNGDSILVKKQSDLLSLYVFKLIFVPTSEALISVDLAVK
ncbi:MAG: type IV pilin [Thermoplasmata archaeon]